MAAAQSLLHSDAFPRKGAMLLSGSVTVENNAAAVLVGYADEAVRGMARIRLLDGRLPEAPGEIALERAAAFRLNAELGGTVTAAVTLADGRSETRTWKVTGLLQNYAALWESNYRYTAGHFPEDVTIQPLNGLLCEQEAAALCALPYLYLLDAPRPDGAYIAAHIPDDVLYVCNNTVYRELPSSGVGLPSEKETFLYVGIIAGAVLFTLASILIGAFLLTVEKRRRQLALLALCGGHQVPGQADPAAGGPERLPCRRGGGDFGGRGPVLWGGATLFRPAGRAAFVCVQPLGARRRSGGHGGVRAALRPDSRPAGRPDPAGMRRWPSGPSGGIPPAGGRGNSSPPCACRFSPCAAPVSG